MADDDPVTRVGLIMGSRSDWPVMAGAAEVLDALVGSGTKRKSYPHTERRTGFTTMQKPPSGAA